MSNTNSFYSVKKAEKDINHRLNTTEPAPLTFGTDSECHSVTVLDQLVQKQRSMPRSTAELTNDKSSLPETE